MTGEPPRTGEPLMTGEPLKTGEPPIPAPDYEGKDVWGGARRYRGGQGELGGGSSRDTLKAVVKNRPPVADIVREITKVITLPHSCKLSRSLTGCNIRASRTLSLRLHVEGSRSWYS